MDLSYDSGSTNKRKKCPNCKSKYFSANRFILDRGSAFAIAFIDIHKHHQTPEIFITCILGTWENGDYSNNVTFACRYGKVENQQEYACTLIDVPHVFSSSMAGTLLTRGEGLRHKRINEFWHIVDFIIESDLAIHDFLHHPIKSRVKSLLRI